MTDLSEEKFKLIVETIRNRYEKDLSNGKYKKTSITQKYLNDPKYILNGNISAAIWFSLKHNRKGRGWENLVGYTLNDLIKHLKSTIPEGYTWQDFLQGKLHIDHIIPRNALTFTKPEHPDFRRCWALENLRLLPARENIIKGKKIEKPFQPTLKIFL